jgi:predicted transcriptional regulator
MEKLDSMGEAITTRKVAKSAGLGKNEVFFYINVDLLHKECIEKESMGAVNRYYVTERGRKLCVLLRDLNSFLVEHYGND